MKINVEIDCTPDDARKMIGLPDLTLVHDKFVAALTDAMAGKVGPEMIDGMLRSWAPVGDAGLNFWRKMFEDAGKPNS